MIGVDRRLAREHARLRVGEVTRNIVEQRGLVAFQGQHVVAALVDDLFGDVPLATHRIGGDGASFEVEKPQKLGNRRDLVRLLVCGDLRQNQPLLARPRADHVQGRLFARRVKGAAQRLAVDRNHAGRLLRKRPHELGETCAKRNRIE